MEERGLATSEKSMMCVDVLGRMAMITVVFRVKAFVRCCYTDVEFVVAVP